ncbi:MULTISPECIES: DUF928 domain-containing protein [Calothrix]|uniref:DUF928 domain-containing protein n=2 Tax=Calothrix TaxID=1186 RepID=A0ABR8A7K7_9CYAN|nr:MULTISPECIES: DUF928 domain-containing protein [Calothrix]MBD2195804.1 DUF928 domain-containing protein [Calothrix parietina FACHB-288]MBD2226447.1 DUF928 domain-containing protein [Calothrix anomala FACHB-343]
MKSSFKSIKWILPTVLILSNVIQYPVLVKAQTQLPSSSPKPASSNKPVSPPKNQSRPIFRWTKPPAGLSTISGRSIGMGSRNLCPYVQIPLMALVPFKERDSAKNSGDKSVSTISMDVWGLTTDERPSFWFYVPYTKEIANASAEFVLQDSQENEVYKNAVSLRAKPGVINVELPSTTLPLEVGKTYRWFFKVNCSGQDSASIPIYVEGDVQRINLDSSLANQIATAQPQDKIAIYAANGIWFDALNLLAQLRKANPNNASLESDWQSLLESIKLGNIAKAPLEE